jgi:hypothetical protein
MPDAEGNGQFYNYTIQKRREANFWKVIYENAS